MILSAQSAPIHMEAERGMLIKFFSSHFAPGYSRLALLFCAILFCGPAMHGQSNRHILPVTYCCPVSDAPFSGTRVMDYEPSPGSSDPKPVHGEEVFYRDSIGRTRSEVSYGDQPAQITLLDFAKGFFYRWTANDNIVTRYKLPNPGQKPEAPEKVDLPADAPVVEGVPTRYQHFSENKYGVQSNVQNWYAPSLKINLTMIREEVGIGKTTYRYQHVKLGEPDAALFRVPANTTVRDAEAKPPSPPPPPAPATPSTITPPPPVLPHPIEDDNYLEAARREQNALFRPYMRGDYRVHVEARLIDLDGKSSEATLDIWMKNNQQRTEESAPGWHFAYAQTRGQNWALRSGTSPMRLYDLSRIVQSEQRTAFGRIDDQVKGYMALQNRAENGEPVRCSGMIAGAEVCFYAKTGYLASMTLDGERVVYREWATFNDKTYGAKIYPARFQLYRGERLQMEGKMSVEAIEEMDPKLLEKPADGEATFSINREELHEVLYQGKLADGLSGEALVRIHVDTSGRVTSAELIDADDKEIGAAAVEAARNTVYMPLEVEGVRKPFETVHHFSGGTVHTMLSSPRMQ
jgi:TonB family protein